MGAFLEIDRRRQETERLQAARTEARERRTLRVAGLVFALIATLAVGFVLSHVF
jgi:hypothetical protein